MQHANTPPYQSQVNPVERVNRTVKRKIMAYAHMDHCSWDAYLSEIAFWCNTVEHSSTGARAATLNFGRQLTAAASLRRKGDQLALREWQRRAVDKWQELLAKLPEQEAHKRRDVKFVIRDLV